MKAMLFILDNSKDCVYDVYFDCRGPEQLCVMCVVLGNHLSEPGSSYCGPVNCVTLFVEGIMHCYQFLWEN